MIIQSTEPRTSKKCENSFGPGNETCFLGAGGGNAYMSYLKDLPATNFTVLAALILNCVPQVNTRFLPTPNDASN
jgi:hypothetical protein